MTLRENLKHVFVLARDGGCEGHSAPLQVFMDEESARAAVALARAVYGSGATVYPVPVWPEPAVDDPKPLEDRT